MPELIWDDRYDKDGRRVAPLRVALPFQTVETVNETAQQRQLSMDRFLGGRDAEWRNRLIWGDNKYVLPSLLQEFAGKVDLISIDPPFATGQDFSFRARVDEAEFEKEPSIIEQKAYRDTWGGGLDSYVAWLHETVSLLRELLAQEGSIYVHLDWRVVHYAKAIMDDIFGAASYRNEVIWKRDVAGKGAKRVSGQWPRNADQILFYSKSPTTWFFEQQYRSLSEEQKRAYRYADPDGRRFKAVQLGDYSAASIQRMQNEGLIYESSTGQRYKKYFLDEAQDTIDCIWTDILGFGTRTAAGEQTGYPTQKPGALLERIIEASSKPDDLVLDCFVGSGTTAAVAGKLGRRWIACDLGRFAIHTTRKRLLDIPNVRPFVVQNLGRYERQVWQAAYRRFILELYSARQVAGYTWLHGIKAGRMVHVGAVDSPVSPGDISKIAIEFRRAVGTGTDAPSTNGVDVLGWDFAFELNEVALQHAREANLNLRFLRIPRDVMDKRAVEQGDVRFFELAALGVDASAHGLSITLALTDFMIPPRRRSPRPLRKRLRAALRQVPRGRRRRHRLRQAPRAVRLHHSVHRLRREPAQLRARLRRHHQRQPILLG